MAYNYTKAVSELHSIDVVHGDLATENILVHPETLDVKLIDFDLASMAGTTVKAGGNPDFVTLPMQKAMAKGSKVEAEVETDLYALALCLYLLLGDRDKLFFKSLSDESIPIKEKEKMVI